MSNSQFLLGALIIAFLVWITTKGELPTYFGFFTVANSTSSPTSQGNNAVSSLANIASNSGSNNPLMGAVNGTTPGVPADMQGLLSGDGSVPNSLLQ